MNSTDLPFSVRVAAAMLAATFAMISIAMLNPARSAAEPVAVTAGKLDWGLKDSWRNYIGPAGTTLLDGATRNADGTFSFPVADGSYDVMTKETVIQFGGGVEFLGHCSGAGGTHVRPCSLDMTLRNFRVEITEDHAGIFVDSESRPIEGGEIVVDRKVNLVDLDVENAEPVIDAGKTTWAGLAGFVSLEGSRIFTYPLGTLLDPITFEYQGPGGKPIGETWDAPGVTDLAASDAGTQPTQIASRIVGKLSTGDLVGWHQSGSIAILDPATLQAKSQWLAGVSGTGTANLFRDSVVIDPGSDTIFAAERTTNVGDRKLVAYSWNGTALTATEIAGSYDPTLNYDSGSGGTWDAANDRYLIARATSVAEHNLWQVKLTDGVWTASKVGRIQRIAPGSLFGNALVNIQAVPDGQGGSTVVGTTLFGAGHVVRLTKAGGEFRPEKLQEAGNINADRLFQTANGLYAVSSNDGTAAFVPFEGYSDGRRLGEAGAPVPFTPFLDPNLNQGQVTFDFATDTLAGLTDSNTLTTRIERGQTVYKASVGGAPYPGGLIGLNPQGKVWGQADGKLQTLDVAGVSPSFTSQPEGPVARLLAETDEVELNAAVAGSPAPVVTWQTRIPGSEGWRDLTAGDGADGTRLTSTVGAADRGRQYRVIAENEFGRVASERASLELLTPPAITVQPANVTVTAGGFTELKVMPVGNPEPTVQWQQRLNGVWHDIPGATEPILTFDDVDRGLSGATFRARLENELGSLTSGQATVTVAATSTEPLSFNGGSAGWGISNRWRCYVTGSIARGSIEVGTGVSKVPGTTPTGPLCIGVNPTTLQPWGTGGEAFSFEVDGGSFDPASQKLQVDLKGSVRFIGHAHHSPDGVPVLDTAISDISIEADLGSGRGFVQIDAAGSTQENPEPFAYEDIKLATFDASKLIVEEKDGEVKIEGIETVLDGQGGGVITYPAGERFDPISLTLKVGPRKPEPEPEAVKPRINVLKVKGLRSRTSIAAVVCPATSESACAVRVPGKLKLSLSGKASKKQRSALRKRFAVIAPKSVLPGRAGKVTVALKPAQRRALAGKRLKGTVKVSAKGAEGPWITKRIGLAAKVR